VKLFEILSKIENTIDEVLQKIDFINYLVTSLSNYRLEITDDSELQLSSLNLLRQNFQTSQNKFTKERENKKSIEEKIKEEGQEVARSK
jgi:hypothetical protein